MKINKRKKRILFTIACLFLAGFFLLALVNLEKQDKRGLLPGKKGNDIEKEKKGIIASGDEVKILFGGDVMFDRYIRQIMQKRGDDFVLSDIKKFLFENDVVIANLEGPITGNESLSAGSIIGERNNYVFTFDPEVADVLADNNIKVVNIGNNHILNFGADGAKETKKYLTDSGVKFFGNFNGNDSPSEYVLDVQGVKVGLVNCNQFSVDFKNETLEGIKKMKFEADKIVVYAHWGKEYETGDIEEWEKNLAHEFIDEGADLIIGSHPHVVQKKESYKGKMIYYSLGNFVFDQYFDVNTQKGLLVQLIIDEQKNIKFQEHEISLQKNGKTILK
ncbi:MAG: CapA family protein [Candidatus Moranbacteria bacterium]|jgi:poly-gamma-glutamate synthesis protein (capsule biosynthesis protein)|nr:CapA family protein [Candidatus Moranbacteria bacterium]